MRHSGTAQSRTHQEDLKLGSNPHPPADIDSRSRIAEAIDARQTRSDLASTYQRKLAALDELKQSLLHASLRGCALTWHP